MIVNKFHTFFVPTLCPFSVSGSCPGYHAVFSHHVSLASSWLWCFLRFSLFLITLTALKSTGLVFCRMLFKWNLPVLLKDWDYCVLGRKAAETRWHSSHIKSAYCQHDLPLLMLTLVPGLGRVIRCFSCMDSPFNSSVHSVESHYEHLRSEC